MNPCNDFGLIGLAVMGQNLVLNVESRGFRVSVFNRTASVTHGFVAQHPGKALVACDARRNIAGFAMLRILGDDVELMTIASSTACSRCRTRSRRASAQR